MGGNGGQPPLRLPLTLRGGEGSFPTMALTQNAERNQGLLYAQGPGGDRWVSSPPRGPQRRILRLGCNTVVPAHDEPLQRGPALLFFSSLMVRDSSRIEPLLHCGPTPVEMTPHVFGSSTGLF